MNNNEQNIPDEWKTFKGLTYDQLSTRYTYDPETGTITNRHGKVLKSKDMNGYTKVHLALGVKKYIQVYGHRLAWFLHHGHMNPNLIIDHIDGNPSNNKIENIRLVTQSDNLRNSSLSYNNTTGQIGVTDRNDGKYIVTVKNIYYGTYDDLGTACALA